MYQVVVALVLCLSAVNADWVIQNYYPSGSKGCSTPSSGAAYPLNTCIPGYGGSTSTLYNYSSSNPTVVSSNYYSTGDCTGSTYPSEYKFDTCYYNSSQYTYSATTPKLTGSVTTNRAGKSCTGAITSYSVSYFNVCSSFNNQSYRTVYYGGSQCISQSFENPTCSGTPENAYASSSSDCSTSSLGSTYGCAVNGVYLPQSTLAPSVDPTAVLVTKGYDSPNCAGGVDGTTYSRVASCDGQGTKISINGNTVVRTSYDNFNCTGVMYDSDSSTTIGTCDNEPRSNYSSITTSGSFPASISGPLLLIQDSCKNPTITYAASVPPACLNENATYSYTISCADPGNGNITLTSSYYRSLDCTGAVVETEVDHVEACSSDDGDDATVVRYACGYTFPKTTSGAATITATFSVVVMMVLAFTL